MMATDTGLTIFKASAGSGKTFQLVGEYLRMLYARPTSYRQILAVTFTNKATAEMKERILKELANLAGGGESKYIDFLKEYGSELSIRAKAPSILKLILHDYSRFSVMTIDSFFQKIIRSFAREVRLNNSFRTEINSSQALEDAVDLLIRDIGDNHLLKDWLIRFLEEKLEEGRSWDFRKELISFGKELDKESFRIHENEFSESLFDKDQLSLYVEELKKLLLEAELRLNQFGQQGMELISRSGLTYDQFKGGKNSFANHFNKLINSRFDPPTTTILEACNNPENWSKKTESPQIRGLIERLYHDGLNRILVDSVKALSEEISRINSAKAILKNIYPFGLSGNIALKMKEVLEENNTVLLSDAGQIIGKIIEGNDTPFIYEKVGLLYRHFMLDEFQDTSRQQWTNFKPLIENALASGNSSLVVGDVKQSIYRWRNGDWNLLDNQLAKDLSHQIVHVKLLENNWRSKKNIVDFNNSLFWRAGSFLNDWFAKETENRQFPDLADLILHAYADQYQQCSQKGGKDGLVRISFVEPDSLKKVDFRVKALKLLIEQIETVQKAGVKSEDIAILVRENSEAKLVANALWERKKSDAQPGCTYDVITSETLKIGESPVVRFVVNFFRYFGQKDSKQIRAELLYGYYKTLRPGMDSADFEESIDLHTLFDSGSVPPRLFVQWLDSDSNSLFLSGLLAMPLYDLAISVADHFHLGSIAGEKAYLQAFLDMIQEYGREEFGGIKGFLEWWEATGCNKTLNLPNVRNFIRISSIHQSKGLEFNTVFIPFCNWEIGINPYKVPYLWSSPGPEPFNRLKMVLLKCDSSLKNSIFSYDYYRELLYCTMDNLNLLYVALTRAIDHLFVIMPYKEEIKQVGSVAELVQSLFDRPFYSDSIDQEKYLDFGKLWDPVSKFFQMGELSASDGGDAPAVANGISGSMIFNHNRSMEIRLHAKDYFRLTGDIRSEKIDKGKLMHQIFERIRTRKDVSNAVDRLVTNGLLTFEEGKAIFIEIDSKLEEEPFSDWFSGHWKILNERDILRPGESKHRPDRVLLEKDRAIVIDYKTGEKSDKDIRQMKGYLSDLKKMGYTSCEGHIWYLRTDEIVRVESV